MRYIFGICVSGLALTGCAGFLRPPQTLGELNTGYTYIPVDPLPVMVVTDPPIPAGVDALQIRKLRYLRCVGRDSLDKKASNKPDGNDGADKDHSADVMDALPDHEIRMAMRETTGNFSGGFGPVGVTASGRNYQVVMDSVFRDTTNVRFAIRVGDGSVNAFSLPKRLVTGTRIDVIRLRDQSESDPGIPSNIKDLPGYDEVTIPVYVGIGLRLTADLYTRKGGINLSNLAALAVSADANQSSGSLTLQTLGIYNQQVASTFAVPTELSTASVQAALVSMGAVKAIVYDRDTGTRPRVVGIYNPLPTSDPLLINKIYSALASRPIPWGPCGSA
jgi:hypothetical protein